MNGKNVIKSTGGYLVVGKGFVGSVADATRFDCDVLQDYMEAAGDLGFTVTVEEAPVTKSFAVCYVRSVDVQEDGSVGANDKNPSRRRFATIEEARTHGARFAVRKSAYGAPVGSAGHVGFYTKETNDPVNAKVNPKTGLTNRIK